MKIAKIWIVAVALTFLAASAAPAVYAAGAKDAEKDAKKENPCAAKDMMKTKGENPCAAKGAAKTGADKTKANPCAKK